MKEFISKNSATIENKDTATKYILSYEKEIFNSKRDFDKKYRIDKDNNFYQNTDEVGQGQIKFYQEKPLESEGFLECVGLILESERAMSLSHIDPFLGLDDKMPKINKYYKNEQTNVTILQGQKASFSNDLETILHKLKSVHIKDINIINISSTTSKWGVIFLPNKENNEIIVHYFSDDRETYIAEKYNIGKSIYDKDKNKESQKFFESRDYMPKGFREAQKYFEAKKYNLNELNFENISKDVDLPISEIIRYKKNCSLILWTPLSGFVEKKVLGDELLGNILLTEWDPANTLIFVQYHEKENNSNGFVFCYEPNFSSVYDYFDINDTLSKEELRKALKRSRNAE